MPIIKRLTKKKREYNQDQKEAYNNRQEIYKTEQWKTLRLAYLMKHPLDEIDLKEGITTFAEDVHHIISFTTARSEQEKLQLAFDENNLVALSKVNHSKIHHNKSFRDKWNNYLINSKI